MTLLTSAVMAACSDYNRVLKSGDAFYKYEAAKECFSDGHYNRAALLLNEVLPALRGTEAGEGALYMHGMATLRAGDYGSAATVFRKYYTDYPRGVFAEQARYHCGLALYMGVPEVRLDQTPTYDAVRELSAFVEMFPRSVLAEDAREKVFELQDQLVEKEWLAAKQYYDLGSYFGNCSMGGSNFQACITTAENALREFPLMGRREEFSFLVVRAKFDLAAQSVAERKPERLRAALEECKNFVDEFPESPHRAAADALLKKYGGGTGTLIADGGEDS